MHTDADLADTQVMGTIPARPPHDPARMLPLVRAMPAGLAAVSIGNPRVREAMALARRAARKASLPDNRYARALTVRFRLPSAHDPRPNERRIALLCGWAALLGLGGAVLTLRMVLELFLPGTSWYGVLLMLLGLIGLPATVGAFASIHRRRLPWLLLGVGTLSLLAAYAAS
jgi:hypothetical protein